MLESNFAFNCQRIAEKVKEPSKTISLEDTDMLMSQTVLRSTKLISRTRRITMVFLPRD